MVKASIKVHVGLQLSICGLFLLSAITINGFVQYNCYTKGLKHLEYNIQSEEAQKMKALLVFVFAKLTANGGKVFHRYVFEKKRTSGFSSAAHCVKA